MRRLIRPNQSESNQLLEKNWLIARMKAVATGKGLRRAFEQVLGIQGMDHTQSSESEWIKVKRMV
jgi:hypothetical protein